MSIPNVRFPTPDLQTAGQPEDAADFSELANQGYTDAVNLRPDTELGDRNERAEVEAAGMRYIQIPIAGPEDLNEASAKRLDEALAEASGKVFVHCGSSNRVGALFALRAFHLHGASPAEALQAGKEAGLTGLEPFVTSALGLSGS